MNTLHADDLSGSVHPGESSFKRTEILMDWGYSDIHMNVRWSPEAANVVLNDRPLRILPSGTTLPQEHAFDRWSRLTGGYAL